MEYDEDLLNNSTIKRIEEALEDFRQGRYYTQEEIEGEFLVSQFD